MFFALQIDRSNISGALSDNMLPELGLTTNDYNYGMTIFYISFILAEMPSQMISKKLGPDVWIPIQMVSWSIIAICQCRITGRSTFVSPGWVSQHPRGPARETERERERENFRILVGR